VDEILQTPGPEASHALPAMGAEAARADSPSHRHQLQFISSLGSEMTAGLRGVIALTELLQDQPLGGDAPAYVRTLAECSRTLLDLVADAVEVSRVETGDLTLSPEPVRLRELLDQVEAEWRARANEDGVALGVAFSGDAGLAAELDGPRLRQVYRSLVAHALRRTRRGGVEAGLDVMRQGERVLLRGKVRDTGAALSPERLRTLFDAFEQRASYGTGLGLALSRRVVELMGGRVWAENNQGAGLTIFFEFEARACDSPTEIGEAPKPAAPLSGHLLIVDDNATNRMVAQTLVEMFGCTCETAEDGMQAVEAVTRRRFDALLMDIRMPRLDGVSAARAIRALPGLASLPIIALTANADAEELRSYVEAGMTSVVDKPIKAERLLSTLQQVLPQPTRPRRRRAAA
jgi:CheY-like chemotaxis protein